MPPAPPMFSTGAEPTRSSSVSTCESARAVWSQPPPGSAGAMRFTASRDAARGIRLAGVVPLGELQAARPSIAAMPTLAMVPRAAVRAR